ncbi:MAG TPA: hypothetical protein VNK67_14210 [Burkholderiales bacterium]|nr:hypothetical protein [Burkholderiales bacterium]
MLIHATITVRGEAAELGACESRLRRLLAAQLLKGEATEHHGPGALCYDLKVEGGIPFPAFAQASQEFPGLEFRAEWVDVAAGSRGAATIVAGRLTAQSSGRLETRTAPGRPVYVAAGADRRLVLALVLARAARGQWHGYAITAERDALLRLAREPGSDAVELCATAGAPRWALYWRGDLSAGAFIRDEPRFSRAIAEEVLRELDRLAQEFVAEWIWFASDRPEATAIERERYARSGWRTARANLRSARLARLSAGESGTGALEYSTLGAEERWIKDLVLATWARPG